MKPAISVAVCVPETLAVCEDAHAAPAAAGEESAGIVGAVKSCLANAMHASPRTAGL